MTSINVTNIASSTTKDGLQDFFSYCGAIKNVSLSSDGSSQKATIEFEKASAATTASMLSGGSLDGSNLEIELAQSVSETANKATGGAVDQAKKTADDVQSKAQDAAQTAKGKAGEIAEGVQGKAEELKDNVIDQEHKPRTTIIAEYLASGYIISDDVTKRAIDFDKQHGYSERFTKFLESVDRSLGEKLTKAPSVAPTEKTKEAAQDAPATNTSVGQDPSLVRQVQAQANAVLAHPIVKTRTDWVWSRLSEYYNAIMNQDRIHDFYTQTSRTVQDVHEEAKRIKAEKKKTKA
ncbi:unnamed protein product [Tilletia controversa]|uniref:RRM domain-containing protein n=3 Tax=Tilletia TaxID=13289 RepID=A0A8X7MLH8_9BASI|nr:hypothetical protein CF336_g8464 [Tilletia laevis]KAE8183089.1 hypothetical protein CF328_g8301 [Tilletia controversa]KAE8242853.1 hypothetical protein A4X03_0g7947 [Tilletia caries]KAE8183945.1 hypothetical protein CF335_g8169 [Tilletia laevis]KAE8239797.1 hypothetical protein A4X06_0g8038 [Tilletia controversa]